MKKQKRKQYFKYIVLNILAAAIVSILLVNYVASAYRIRGSSMNSTLRDRERIIISKISLALGHEFLLGRFLFSQQFGIYLYKPYRVGDDVYQRYGLVYRATDRFQVGINLKAHKHVADFLDIMLGMNF